MALFEKRTDFRKQLLAEAFPKEWDAWLASNMAHYPLLADVERKRLQDIARVIIWEKTWEGCDGLKITEVMKLTIAAQAALLLLGIEHDYFARVLSVVLFPTSFELPARSSEVRGQVVGGVAVNYGSVFLSWDMVLAQGRDASIGKNIVIHEFAHQLDFLDGYTNGTPALNNRGQTQRWRHVMQGTFQRLRHSLQEGHKTFLGDYAAKNPTEFFSVASEKFFTLPNGLRENHPEVFEVLAEFYRLDPTVWFQTHRSPTPRTPIALSEGAQIGDDFVDFNCPYCGNPISFPSQQIGRLAQCPTCLEAMIVPAATGEPVRRIPFPLETERLVLRRFRPVDAEDLAGVMSNPETFRFVDAEPINSEEAATWIEQQMEIPFPAADDSRCSIALEEKKTARVIGYATFSYMPSKYDVARFEIILHPQSQRQGFASETVRALLVLAFEGLRAHRVLVHCDARNEPALNLFRKANFRQESHSLESIFRKDEWINIIGFAMLQREYEDSLKK